MSAFFFLLCCLPLTHKHTHTAGPAGRWRLAFCCHQGILGGVYRKEWGVNWVSTRCKSFWVKAWYSSSWCFHSTPPPPPRGYRWWVKCSCSINSLSCILWMLLCHSRMSFLYVPAMFFFFFLKHMGFAVRAHVKIVWDRKPYADHR